MIYSPMGEIAAECRREIPMHFRAVELDLFVVMPNHIHGILFITDDLTTIDVGTRYISSLQTDPDTFRNAEAKRSAIGAKKGSLGAIIGSFKAAVTRHVNTKTHGAKERIWQERYHDRIIRNEGSLNHCREYIVYNPARWSADELYNAP